MHAPSNTAQQVTSTGVVLVVDDKQDLQHTVTTALGHHGMQAVPAASVAEALRVVEAGGVDAVVSDIAMPGRDGLELLREVRKHDLDLPVVLMTGAPDLHSAIAAVELGALRYITKPFETRELVDIVRRATSLYRLARAKREVMTLMGTQVGEGSDRIGLTTSFDRALAGLWMAYQPILASDGTVFGYEALLRSDEPALPNPGAIIDAAMRLHRLPQLTETIRQHVERDLAEATTDWTFFLNLHPHDLLDPALSGTKVDPFANFRQPLVLEITEREALDTIEGVTERVDTLRGFGHSIAIDDLGAGYAGLSSFLHLRPEVVKLDMGLTRSIDGDPSRKRLVAAMISMCHELGAKVVAEGVETVAERDVLVQLGADLLQGFLFARPARPFVLPRWPT